MNYRLVNRFNKVYIIFLIFITSILLCLYAYSAFYARPTGDDLGYAAHTRYVWEETKSVGSVLNAAIETTVRTYNTEDASFVMTFLCALIPEVFHPWTFWISIWFILFLFVFAVIFTTYELCYRKLNLPKGICAVIASTIIFLYLQHMPSTCSGMYWFTGSVHYVMPYSLLIISIALMSRLLECFKIRYIVLLSVFGALIGGSGYFAAMYLTFAYIVYGIILMCRKPGKKYLTLLLPLMVTLICFGIVLLSPGQNSARAGGELKITLSLAISTVIESIRRAAVYPISWFKDTFFVLPCILLFVLSLIFYADWSKVQFQFPHPVLVSIGLFLAYAAIYSPWVFSENFDKLGASVGPLNYAYMTFLITIMAILIYCIGAYKKRVTSSHVSPRGSAVIQLGVVILLLIFAVINRHDLKESHSYVGVNYIVSGQAKDYKNQCEQNMKMLLDPAIKNVTLVQTNADQGLLCNMVATDNPNDFTSYAYAKFYNKDSVVMLSE